MDRAYSAYWTPAEWDGVSMRCNADGKWEPCHESDRQGWLVTGAILVPDPTPTEITITYATE